MLAVQVVLAQKQKAKTRNNFYFYYGQAGLGSNVGSFQPALRIYGNKFTYTKEQNSYWGKRSNKIEIISKGFIRQSSIDSILSLVQALKDTEIRKTNFCILSGGVTYIKIALGGDTTKFTLQNTSDLTALKIISIINPYLPKDYRLRGSEKEIKDEEDCESYWKKETKRIKDSINARQ